MLAQILFDSGLSQSRSSHQCLCAHVRASAEAFCKGAAARGWLQRVIHGNGALPFFPCRGTKGTASALPQTWHISPRHKEARLEGRAPALSLRFHFKHLQHQQCGRKGGAPLAPPG